MNVRNIILIISLIIFLGFLSQNCLKVLSSHSERQRINRNKEPILILSPSSYKIAFNDSSAEFKEGIKFFEIAEQHFNNEHFESALKGYREALTYFKLAKNIEAFSFCLCRIAETYQFLNSLEKAHSAYLEALKFSFNTNNLLHNLILRRYVHVLVLTGRIEEAKHISEKVLIYFTQTNDQIEVYACLLDQIFIAAILGEFEEAQEIFHKALKIIKTKMCHFLKREL